MRSRENLKFSNSAINVIFISIMEVGSGGYGTASVQAAVAFASKEAQDSIRRILILHF